MKEKTKLTIIGLTIAGLIVVPMLFSVIGGLISVSTMQKVSSENPFVVSSLEKWTIYNDAQNGFSLSYPPEMYLADKPFGVFSATFLLADLKNLEQPEESTPRIQVYKSDTPIEEFVKTMNEQRNKDQFPEFHKLEFEGKVVYQTKALDPEVIFTETVIGNDNKSYLLELFTIEKKNDELIKAYEEMVKSFKILDE